MFHPLKVGGALGRGKFMWVPFKTPVCVTLVRVNPLEQLTTSNLLEGDNSVKFKMVARVEVHIIYDSPTWFLLSIGAQGLCEPCYPWCNICNILKTIQGKTTICLPWAHVRSTYSLFELSTHWILSLLMISFTNCAPRWHISNNLAIVSRKICCYSNNNVRSWVSMTLAAGMMDQLVGSKTWASHVDCPTIVMVRLWFKSIKHSTSCCQN